MPGLAFCLIPGTFPNVLSTTSPSTCGVLDAHWPARAPVELPSEAVTAVSCPCPWLAAPPGGGRVCTAALTGEMLGDLCWAGLGPGARAGTPHTLPMREDTLLPTVPPYLWPGGFHTPAPFACSWSTVKSGPSKTSPWTGLERQALGPPTCGVRRSAALCPPAGSGGVGVRTQLSRRNQCPDSSVPVSWG